MGLLAATIFAGQMLNFSVAGGTSGHLLGAALAAILIGPWASVVVLTCVVGVQALLFQDGGLLALGANIFNMAIVGSFVAYAIYQIVQRLAAGKRWGALVGGFAAAWASILIASLSCALQLAASGTSPANIAFPAMGGIHALIGIGEGLITVGALSFLMAARRDLLEKGTAQKGLQRGVIIAGLAIALLLAVLSPLASSHPDGLEWVAEQQGFLEQAQEPLYTLIPDYVFPGIPSEALATILAGIVGTLLVFGVAIWAARANHRQSAA
jgi:cobalt/nickel transport system permease protein